MFDLLTNNKLEAAVAYFEVELPGICVVALRGKKGRPVRTVGVPAGFRTEYLWNAIHNRHCLKQPARCSCSDQQNQRSKGVVKAT